MAYLGISFRSIQPDQLTAREMNINVRLSFLNLLAVFLLAASVVLVSSAPASARPIPVFGGPTYDPATQTGYQSQSFYVRDGAAVGAADKYESGNYRGQRAFRFDATGAPATLLGDLGTDATGYTDAAPFAVNAGGTIIGAANKYVGGTSIGYRGVRWDPSSTAAVALAEPDAGAGNHFTNVAPYTINGAGVAAGEADMERDSDLEPLGDRPVRWNAAGTVATQLGNLGTDPTGYTTVDVNALNAAGTTVGFTQKYVSGTDMGPRAVRWDASGTAATELGNLGTDADGYTYSTAYAINAAGTAVGYADKRTTDWFGQRAVRWDASGTAATELPTLGTDTHGFTNSIASAINDTGIVIGNAIKYSGDTQLGSRGVRWDAAGNITELGNLGTDSSGVADTYPYAINSAGVVVGSIPIYSGGFITDMRAVLWRLDGTAIDLNSVIDPASGWTLSGALGITDTNWVTGYGKFDPDGSGPLDPYTRAFLLDASSIITPEPATLSLLALVLPTAFIRRRR